MDLLSSITGSRVRADVLAALFASERRSHGASELGRWMRLPRQLVHRELKRLAAAGVVRVSKAAGRRQYERDVDTPVARELVRLIRQTRGRIPRIRHALVSLRSPSLAWLVAAPAGAAIGSGRRGERTAHLFVLTGAPRSLVRVQLANIVDRTTEVHSMSVREWVARLEKGDVLLRDVRRGQKLWVLGSWETLLAREHVELGAKHRSRSAVANWRGEPSDEWDEDWDPFAPVPGPA